MSLVFADTYYFLALLNPRDEAHQAALSVGSFLPGKKLVTTQYVLLEVADAFARPVYRPRFIGLLETLRSDDAGTRIVEGSPDLFQAGVELYRERGDKAWPLTDCVSFVVMRQMEITEALTADPHFRQAGFICLLEQQ